MPLTLLAPDAWRMSFPPKRWDRRTRTWTFRPSLSNLDLFADKYTSYLMSSMLSHALILLNRHASYDDEGDVFLAIDADQLADALRRHTLLSAHKAGMRFTPGRSRPRHLLDGDLSRVWLDATARNTARLALEYWDPDRGIRSWASAVNRARRPRNRSTVYTADMLPPGSITAQMEALNCSRSTIRRLRQGVTYD